jgi:hypothetical protein
MLEKNPTNRADIEEIFRTIKLFTCDNKTIYSLEELLTENLGRSPTICLISSLNDDISLIVKILRLTFSNHSQLSFIFKNNSNSVSYKDFDNMDNQLDLSNLIQVPITDVYECANRYLNWDDGKKILINLSKSDSDSVFIKKIRNNMRVNMFQLPINLFKNILNRIMYQI